MRGLPILTVVVLLGSVGSVSAQSQSVVGRAFVPLYADSAASGRAEGPSTLDPNGLLALQLRREEGSWARRGALLGALAGGIATYLVIHHGGSTSLCDRSANQDAIGRRECVVLTVAGGAAGAGLGAWIGGRFRRK
jgi:hypothetical protein